jgi:RNA polymerase sigma-70 factor (ECF subfamily)
LVAALTRRFGVDRLPSIENAIQDAYVRALERWPTDGAPDDPERWLVRVAHNALVDALRKEAPLTALEPHHDRSVEAPTFDTDDELRLVFLCCEPMLMPAAQVTLALNVTFGLTAAQIATAFLSTEATVAQRLVRAKQRLRTEQTRFELPSAASLPSRLSRVLEVVYLVFSEGYGPTIGDATLDLSLCNEALRLVRLLTESARTALPVAFALRALVCLHLSRVPARTADDGTLLLIPEQDRQRWDAALIGEAFQYLDRAGTGHELSRFHLEAAIAACHAVAPHYTATDWPRVLELYDLLRQQAPSLVVDVNRAIAVAMCHGARMGLDTLDAIPERDVVARYPFALAAYAELHASLGDVQTARTYLTRALSHQPAAAQRTVLARRLAALNAPPATMFGA